MLKEVMMKELLPKLLDYDFDQLFVSHGPPILSGAKAMLQAVLEKQ
jgi:hypothetical protein